MIISTILRKKTHLISLYKIGDMYLNGLYVEKNEKEAFRICRRCLETVTEEAERRVAGSKRN